MATRVTRLLLGYLNPDHKTSMQSSSLEKSLVRWRSDQTALWSMRSSLTYSEAALEIAVSWQDPDHIKFVLGRCECVRVTNEILNAAIEILVDDSGHTLHHRVACVAEVIHPLLLHDPDMRIQNLTIQEAISHPIRAIQILHVFCKHGKSLSGRKVSSQQQSSASLTMDPTSSRLFSNKIAMQKS